MRDFLTATQTIAQDVAKRSHTVIHDLKRKGLQAGKQLLGGIFFEFSSSALIFQLYPLGIIFPFHFFPSSRKITARRPILLIHGIFHNHSAFFSLKRRLQKAGWKNIQTSNLYTYANDIPTLAERLACQVEKAQFKNKGQKIDIIAHSMGGIVARYFIQLLGGHRYVRNLVTLGTPHQGTALSVFPLGKSLRNLQPKNPLLKKLNESPPPRSVRFLSIWSTFDAFVVPHEAAEMHAAPNVFNIRLDYIGHAGLLFSKAVFEKVAGFLEPSWKEQPLVVQRKEFHSVEKRVAVQSLLK